MLIMGLPGEGAMVLRVPYQQLHHASNTTMAHGQFTMGHPKVLSQAVIIHSQCSTIVRDLQRRMTSTLGQKLFH